MNRNDDFNRVLEAWLDRQAPPQAPDRVLDAALERVQGESQRRGWLQRLFGGTTMNLIYRTTAVAAAVVLAILIGLQFSNLTDEDIGATPSPSPSASADPRSSTVPSASPDSPEPSAEPSAAALVFRLLGGGEAGRVHLVTVMEDGRVITTEPGGVNPPLERRLTPSGVQLVRDELAATGLTETSAEYLPVPNPGAEPPPYGGAGPSLEVGSADSETVVVSWLLFGDTEEDYFQPQPEAEALEALAARLTTLETWLPADAWADATGTPHEPSAYVMTITLEPWGGSLDELPVEYATVEWPLPGELTTFGDRTNPAPNEIRCGIVDAEEGSAVIEALEAAGAEPGFEARPAFRLGDRAGTRHIVVSLESTLVASEGSC
jgi:hypothetical protein